MKALVIDDARAMRKIIGRLLVGLGYEVREAGNGQEALDILNDGYSADLACVDWNMPEMDGLSFVVAVRNEPQWQDLTLMMVTTESETSQIVKALAAGAHEYLIKPFTSDAMADKLQILGLLPEQPTYPG